MVLGPPPPATYLEHELGNTPLQTVICQCIGSARFIFAHEKAPEGNRALFPDVMLCNEKEEKIRGKSSLRYKKYLSELSLIGCLIYLYYGMAISICEISSFDNL